MTDRIEANVVDTAAPGTPELEAMASDLIDDRSGGVHDLGGGRDNGNALPFDCAPASSDLSQGVGRPRTCHCIPAMRGVDGNVWSHARDGAEWKTLVVG